MRKRMLFAGAATLALAGCGSNVEPGFVAKQWSGEMRELQINPVFPPREDFQVGDIYLPAVPQDQVDQVFDDEGYLPMSVWLMEAGGDGAARKALKSFYDERSTYPQTTKAVVDSVTGAEAGGSEQGQNGGNGNQNGGTGEAGLSGPVSQPVLDCEDVANGTDCNIFTGNEKTKMRRMRIVGFPTFLSTTITQGNLSAFVPVEAFSAALGLDVGDVEAVSVNVPVAESVGVPAITALELAKKSLSSTQTPICPGNLPGKSQRSSGSGSSSNDAQTSAAQQDTDKADEQEQERKKLGAIAALLPNGQRESDGRVGTTFHAIVVNEVYYTRAIEISVKTQQSFGLGARLQTLAPTGIVGGSTGTGQQGEGSGGDGGANPSSQPGAQRSTSVPGPVQTYNRLLNATSNLPSAPGGSLQVVSVADGNIGMRRMFDRPIAIGYRGASLLVDSQTCNVIGGGPVGDLGSGGPLAAPLGSVLQTHATEDASDDPQGDPTSTPGTRGGGTSRDSGMSVPLENKPAER
jgi:hypothetical protein